GVPERGTGPIPSTAPPAWRTRPGLPSAAPPGLKKNSYKRMRSRRERFELRQMLALEMQQPLDQRPGGIVAQARQVRLEIGGGPFLFLDQLWQQVVQGGIVHIC